MFGIENAVFCRWYLTTTRETRIIFIYIYQWNPVFNIRRCVVILPKLTFNYFVVCSVHLELLMVLIGSVIFMYLLWLIIMIARRSTLTETTDYSESGSAVSTSSVFLALSPTQSYTATTTRLGRHCPVHTVWLLRLQGLRKKIYKLIYCESSEMVTITR